MQGRYAVRAKRLAPLHEEAVRLARIFERIEFEWVPREQNEEADALSRRGFDAFLSDHGADYRSYYL
jgi:ribonuclease HI